MHTIAQLHEYASLCTHIQHTHTQPCAQKKSTVILIQNQHRTYKSTHISVYIIFSLVNMHIELSSLANRY